MASPATSALPSVGMPAQAATIASALKALGYAKGAN